MTLNTEADKYFRETPPEVDTNQELEDRLNEVDQSLTEEQIKALQL